MLGESGWILDRTETFKGLTMEQGSACPDLATSLVGPRLKHLARYIQRASWKTYLPESPLATQAYSAAT